MKWKVVIHHLCGSEGITWYPREGGTSHAAVGAVLTAVEVSVGEEGTQSNNVGRFNVGRVVINLWVTTVRKITLMILGIPNRKLTSVVTSQLRFRY